MAAEETVLEELGETDDPGVAVDAIDTLDKETPIFVDEI
jgi:hypothetical protein